ncbi:MAG TPA: aldose epimerase family protein [Balneolaceae bacterium]|nr:aldose epimerase family protein [Balneolaceae bacterium]
MNMLFAVGTLSILVAGCAKGNKDTKQQKQKTELSKQKFGQLEDGRQVELYTLTNGNKMEVQITNYGARVTNIRTPDRDGQMGSVVLGFDSLKKYRPVKTYFGAIIGRYANRIANAKFSIDGKEYTLPANDGDNTLHGGTRGFESQLWNANPMDNGSLKLSYLSKDGEEGFPGNVHVNVTYTLTQDNELKIEYEATTDKATPINLTNHSYFNLSGHPDQTVMDQELKINADHYTPVNDELIPTGEIASVKGTPFDFTEFHTVGSRFDQTKGGYDHNFVLNRTESDSLFHAATVYSPSSGREMKVFTTQPGVQFYSGNFLDGSLVGQNGYHFVQHGALCLETQHYPNSPNQSNFPNTILKPGQTYHQVTVYQFSNPGKNPAN